MEPRSSTKFYGNFRNLLGLVAFYVLLALLAQRLDLLVAILLMLRRHGSRSNTKFACHRVGSGTCPGFVSSSPTQVSAYRTDWPAFRSNSALDTLCSRIVGRDAGVVSLAAALALPSKFPARDVIVFLAFCSIFATLIVQGATLGWLVRKLEVIELEQVSAEPAEALARAEIADAALEAIKENLEPRADSQHTVATAALVNEYEARADRAAEEKEAESPENAEQFNAARRLRLVAIEAARDKLLEHTDKSIQTRTVHWQRNWILKTTN